MGVIARPGADHIKFERLTDLPLSVRPPSRLPAMVFIASALLLGASILSVGAQTTSAPAPTTTSPPASTPTIGKTALPLTEYSFTYPNLVRGSRTVLQNCADAFASLLARASQPFQLWTRSSVWLQCLQLDNGTSAIYSQQRSKGADSSCPQEGPTSQCQTSFLNSIDGPCSPLSCFIYHPLTFRKTQISVFGVHLRPVESLVMSKPSW